MIKLTMKKTSHLDDQQTKHDTQVDAENTSSTQKTHFGYQTVPTEEKVEKVASVFSSVAPHYDLMNDVMSLGIHRLWKKFTIEKAMVRKGAVILDLAGGTGDLTSAFFDKVGNDGQIILADINNAMLQAGRNRLIDEGKINHIQYVQANAECLPFADNTFDLITIAFGLRNVTFIDKALASMCRVLKPGGKLLILEFSKPTTAVLRKIYDEYSFKLLPKLGKYIADDEESYRYLAESIRMHPAQDVLKQMILDAGFDAADYHNLSGGIVALHEARKY